MLKINELNSYLKSKGVPEDSYSINEVNDESLCSSFSNKSLIDRSLHSKKASKLEILSFTILFFPVTPIFQIPRMTKSPSNPIGS